MVFSIKLTTNTNKLCYNLDKLQLTMLQHYLIDGKNT